MSEPTGHCPFLGLKQNRAIRFSSPTSEHRCYISGEPLEIPVDQPTYCLSRGHTQCPLYMGLTPPTTNLSSTEVVAVPASQAAGVGGWFASLSSRDRIIYALMLALLAGIVALYVIAGLQSIAPPAGAAPTIAPTAAAPRPTEAAAPASAGTDAATATTAAQTDVPPSPTPLPTSQPTLAPSALPTSAPVVIVPTSQPTLAPSPLAATPSLAPTTSKPTVINPTPVKPTAAKPTAVNPSVVKPTAANPTVARPTAVPTRAPATALPATAVPATAVPPTPVKPTPAPAISSERVWLYYGDSTGTLYVPVQRTVQVEDRRVAEAAVRALSAGPRNGLERLIAADAQLIGVQIADGTAVVNFDRDPRAVSDSRALGAIVLTLTHFPSIGDVEVQVNGRALNLNGQTRLKRPIVNPLNPSGLSGDPASTEFLPLYFLANDAVHTVRVVRLVPKTKQTAAATVAALLEGPGEYGYALQRVIPGGTSLIDLTLADGVATVDLSYQFADAGDRDLALKTLAQSLTSIKTVQGVRVLVEGRPLGDVWSDGRYSAVISRPLVNPE